MTFDLGEYRDRLRRRSRRRILSLLMLTGVMALIYLVGGDGLSMGEERLWSGVREAETAVADWRRSIGSFPSITDDPWNLGLIGLEWSPLSTTLGSLPSKRTACHPDWAVVFLRWFRSLGLSAGDPVVIMSSSSFPGLLLNMLMASEFYDLDVHLVVSLGSSTWGCNDPKAPWPTMAKELRRRGFLSTRAYCYTLGGGGEVGSGISPEGIDIMTSAAMKAGVPVLSSSSKEEVVGWKMDFIGRVKPKVVVSIGGSSANMGDDPAVLSLPPGISKPGAKGGDGVIGRSLKEGYTVIHLLNLRDLALAEGVPFDSEPVRGTVGRRSIFLSLSGLAVYIGATLFFSRFSHGGETLGNKI